MTLPSQTHVFLSYLFDKLYPTEQKQLFQALSIPSPTGILSADFATFVQCYDNIDWLIQQIKTAVNTPEQHIITLLKRQAFDQALLAFEALGGEFICLTLGVDEAERLVQQFPKTWRDQQEVLILARIANAIKRGAISHAQHLLVTYFGNHAHQFDIVLRNAEKYSRRMRLLVFWLFTYENQRLHSTSRIKLSNFLGEFEPNDHLYRGLFNNLMLVEALSSSHRNESLQYIQRALHHYQKAKTHYLSFFILLHKSLFTLEDGHLQEAKTAIATAKSLLTMVTFDCQTEQRFVRLVEAICAIEDNNTSLLETFIRHDFQDFSHGESWSKIANFAIFYSTAHICHQQDLMTALRFLDRTRAIFWQQMRSVNGLTLIEVELLQSQRHWQPAREKLSMIKSRINFHWIESAFDDLKQLNQIEEIGITLCTFRHLVWHFPKRIKLDEQLQLLHSNTCLPELSRLSIILWRAYIKRRTGQLAEAAKLYQSVLGAIGQEGCHRRLLSESCFINALNDTPQIKLAVSRYADVMQVLERLQTSTSTKDEYMDSPLTRQERRVLTMVAEGCSNKQIARALRLSESTIKYHLLHVFKKLACKNRFQAVAIAREKQWIRALTSSPP